MGLIFKNTGDTSIGQTIGIATVTALMATLNGYLFYKKGKALIKKLKGEKVTPSEKLEMIRATSIVSNLTLISMMLSRYYWFNQKRIKPAAVLAGIPLGTVEELSMTLSDRIVKYRASGGIFLAHQDGGNESLRIICKAWGKSRYMFLIMLDFLFLYGSSKNIDLFSDRNKFGVTQEGMRGILTKDEFIESQQIKNPWKDFDIWNKDEGREEYHLTFPIVTKNRIFSSMYLETYDIVESVNTGMNMLTVTLFLRKYRAPYPLEMTELRVPKEKSEGIDSTFWYRRKLPEKIGESTQSIYTGIRSLRFIDSIMDFGLSLIVMLQKYYTMMEYSIYTPEQMYALTFATHLDKSKGLDAGINFGLFRDKKGNLNVSSVLSKGMGMLF